MATLNPEEQYAYLFPARDVRYAGFWQRLAALIIDVVVTMPVKYLIAYVIDGDFNLIEGNSITSELVEGLFDFLYMALMESGAWQATIGKRVLGIKVCTVQGDRISFGKATARYFSKILSAIILLIGFLMMLWDDRKQTLHDKIANTLVVQV